MWKGPLDQRPRFLRTSHDFPKIIYGIRTSCKSRPLPKGRNRPHLRLSTGTSGNFQVPKRRNVPKTAIFLWKKICEWGESVRFPGFYLSKNSQQTELAIRNHPDTFGLSNPTQNQLVFHSNNQWVNAWSMEPKATDQAFFTRIATWRPTKQEPHPAVRLSTN